MIILIVCDSLDRMSLTRKTITIPEAMESWIKNRLEIGQYGNESEYFRDLVRRDQERHASIDKLRILLDRAEASGASDKSLEQIRAEVRKDLGL